MENQERLDRWDTFLADMLYGMRERTNIASGRGYEAPSRTRLESMYGEKYERIAELSKETSQELGYL